MAGQGVARRADQPQADGHRAEIKLASGPMRPAVEHLFGAGGTGFRSTDGFCAPAIADMIFQLADGCLLSHSANRPGRDSPKRGDAGARGARSQRHRAKIKLASTQIHADQNIPSKRSRESRLVSGGRFLVRTAADQGWHPRKLIRSHS